MGHTWESRIPSGFYGAWPGPALLAVVPGRTLERPPALCGWPLAPDEGDCTARTHDHSRRACIRLYTCDCPGVGQLPGFPRRKGRGEYSSPIAPRRSASPHAIPRAPHAADGINGNCRRRVYVPSTHHDGIAKVQVVTDRSSKDRRILCVVRVSLRAMVVPAPAYHHPIRIRRNGWIRMVLIPRHILRTYLDFARPVLPVVPTYVYLSVARASTSLVPFVVGSPHPAISIAGKPCVHGVIIRLGQRRWLDGCRRTIGPGDEYVILLATSITCPRQPQFALLSNHHRAIVLVGGCGGNRTIFGPLRPVEHPQKHVTVVAHPPCEDKIDSAIRTAGHRRKSVALAPRPTFLIPLQSRCRIRHPIANRCSVSLGPGQCPLNKRTQCGHFTTKKVIGVMNDLALGICQHDERPPPSVVPAFECTMRVQEMNDRRSIVLLIIQSRKLVIPRNDPDDVQAPAAVPRCQLAAMTSILLTAPSPGSTKLHEHRHSSVVL